MRACRAAVWSAGAARFGDHARMAIEPKRTTSRNTRSTWTQRIGSTPGTSKQARVAVWWPEPLDRLAEKYGNSQSDCQARYVHAPLYVTVVAIGQAQCLCNILLEYPPASRPAHLVTGELDAAVHSPQGFAVMPGLVV